MKHLVDLINEGVENDNRTINESKSNWVIDARQLYNIWYDEDKSELEDFEIDPDDFDWLLEHAYMCESLGGYDGDGSSCVDVLKRHRFDMNWLKKQLKAKNMTLDSLEDDDVELMDLFQEGELDKDVCKAFQKMCTDIKGKPMTGMPKRGILWWNAGWASPQVALFDENNKIIDDILENVYGFS
jgi:hypothetical protein